MLITMWFFTFYCTGYSIVLGYQGEDSFVWHRPCKESSGPYLPFRDILVSTAVQPHGSILVGLGTIRRATHLILRIFHPPTPV